MLCLLHWEIRNIFPKFLKIQGIFSKTQNILSLWHILPAIWFCVAGTQIIFYFIPGIWGGNHLDSRSQQTAKTNLKPFPFLETFGEHIPCNLSSLQNIITPQLANTVLGLKGYGVFFWPARKRLKAFGPILCHTIGSQSCEILLCIARRYRSVAERYDGRFCFFFGQEIKTC